MNLNACTVRRPSRCSRAISAVCGSCFARGARNTISFIHQSAALSPHQGADADTRVPDQVCQALSLPGRVRHRRLRVFAHSASAALGAADQRCPGDVTTPTEHTASATRLWWFLVLSRSSCLLLSVILPLLRRVLACSAALSSCSRSLFAVARCSFCFQSPDRSHSRGASATLKSTSQSQ